jgi:hypothetical protein
MLSDVQCNNQEGLLPGATSADNISFERAAPSVRSMRGLFRPVFYMPGTFSDELESNGLS